LLGCGFVESAQRFVYILRSRSDPDRHYTGVTSNVGARLTAHNAGECTHTARNRPWDVDVVLAFRDESRALDFERYLKSARGIAFANRYLRSKPSRAPARRGARFLEQVRASLRFSRRASVL
jgi:predicted GIY-YIG superfamily endonuclease